MWCGTGVSRKNPPGGDQGVAENKTEFIFPESVTLFTCGTLAKNIGFMVELGHEVEGWFVTFNNIGYVFIGRFDPDAFYSYATVCQQLGDVGESPSSTCADEVMHNTNITSGNRTVLNVALVAGEIPSGASSRRRASIW